MNYKIDCFPERFIVMSMLRMLSIASAIEILKLNSE